jgi:hypothetical protein
MIISQIKNGGIKLSITAEKIMDFLNNNGVDIKGIAAVASFSEAPSGCHPKDVLADSKSVIVFGKKFLHSTIYTPYIAPSIRSFMSLLIDRSLFCRFG